MTNTPPIGHLYAGFERSVRAFPDRPALEVGDETVTYATLHALARDLATSILAHEREPRPLVAFLAARGLAAYRSVLGILAAGRGFVPLNPLFPVQRTRTMLALSGVETLVVGPEAVSLLPDLLSGIDGAFTVIVIGEELPDVAEALGRHTFVLLGTSAASMGPGRATGEAPGAAPPVRPVTDTSVAYLLFTSGSTGTPKGVAISQRNVTSYLEYVSRRYDLDETDRFSQSFDLTFDLSVHDMFVCWTHGACLCCVPQRSVMAPARFITERALTVWFSVPSTIGFLQKMRMLKPGRFASLRLSLFCGEPLLVEWARAWREAAPGSRMENLYGPTEATIAISHFRCDDPDDLDRAVNGIVPIGDLFADQRACLVDSRCRPVGTDEPGELCVAGSQIAEGYWNDPARTRERFVQLEGTDECTWYRTGDLARRDAAGCMYYLGRVDDQVQIRGHRVELHEVDHVLREVTGDSLAVAVAWPAGTGRADAVYAFVATGPGVDTEAIIERCKVSLPSYMVPREVFQTEDFPRNASGKIDRRALTDRVGDMRREQASG